MNRISQRQATADRSGMIAPAVAFALLVVLGCVALVLDRLWLDVASTEISSLAESAALSAGRKLVSDDLLRPNSDPRACIKRAREAATQAAATNLVAGNPVFLDASPGGDVRFGKLVRDSSNGLVRFLETDNCPTSVLVTAHRTRVRGNPVALLLYSRNRTGGDVVSRCEVTIDNHVIGLRPYAGVPVPAFPLAILEKDVSGNCGDTWQAQIEQRAGTDEFAYLPQTGEVIPGSDGIPEIHLRSRAILDDDEEEGNVHLVDLGTGLRSDLVANQIADGWSQRSLEKFGGELCLGREGVTMTSSDTIVKVAGSAFAAQVGQCRVCLLYDKHNKIGKTGLGEVHCCRLVAGRVMRISAGSNGEYEIVLQPGVLTTKTAILHQKADGTTVNRYLYKLQLTQ